MAGSVLETPLEIKRVHLEMENIRSNSEHSLKETVLQQQSFFSQRLLESR